MSRSPDPIGLNRDPSKAGRYSGGMRTGVRVGTEARQQERSVAAVSLHCYLRVCLIFLNAMGYHGPHMLQATSKLPYPVKKL